jgi:hypothetical protein
VRAAAVQRHGQAVGAQMPGRRQSEHPRGHRFDVLAEHDVGLAEPLVEAVVDHGAGALADFLGGLEYREQPAPPRAAARGELGRRAQQAGDVRVVPQACITGTSAPRSSAVRSVLA